VWKAFVNSANYSNGQFTGDSTGYLTSSYVTTGSNGLPQLQVYDSNPNTPGSFGLVDTGVPANNTPAFRNWIDTGSTPNDISYLLNNNLLPVSPSAPEPWKVGPGLSSTLISNFQSQIGVPNLIPLFVPASPVPNYIGATGQGQNATYSIIGFVGVTITQADGSGKVNLQVSVQPSSIVDPTEVISNPVPAGTQGTTAIGTSGTTQTTFVSAKLTQ
jgi:hypothetical protein